MENQTNAAVESNETLKLTREQKLQQKYADLVAKIQSDTDKANEIAAELSSIAALAAVQAGSAVTVRLGRKFKDKDTTRFEAGVVLAVKEEEDGSKLYKVQYGSGFDADITVVGAACISLPTTQETVAE